MSQQTNLRGCHYGACSTLERANCWDNPHVCTLYENDCLGWLQSVYIMYIIGESYMFDLWQE